MINILDSLPHLGNNNIRYEYEISRLMTEKNQISFFNIRKPRLNVIGSKGNLLSFRETMTKSDEALLSETVNINNKNIFMKFSGNLGKLKTNHRSYTNFKEKKTIEISKLRNSQSTFPLIKAELKTSVNFKQEASPEPKTVKKVSFKDMGNFQNRNIFVATSKDFLKPNNLVNEKPNTNLKNEKSRMKSVSSNNTNNYLFSSQIKETVDNNKLPSLYSSELKKSISTKSSIYNKLSQNRSDRDVTSNNENKLSLTKTFSNLTSSIQDHSNDSLANSPTKQRLLQPSFKFSSEKLPSREESQNVIRPNQQEVAKEKLEILIKDNLEQEIRLNIVKSFCARSKAGTTPEGTKKINQDNYLTCPNLLNSKEYNLFGVMDGHGMHGHFVSEATKRFFIDYYSNSAIYGETDKSACDKLFQILSQNKNKLIKDSYSDCEELLAESQYEMNFSGTTCVLTFIIGNKLIVANVGDSRTVMGMENDKKKLEARRLSIDHKPELEGERKRIVSKGGRVDRYSENGIQMGPFRLWKKNENYPGLAMSRSLGDFCAHSIGGISEPEIFEYEINQFSKFLLIASDGVWEFLSDLQVVELIFPFYKKNDIIGACEKVIEEATKCWKKEDSVIDDITVVIIFFQ